MKKIASAENYARAKFAQEIHELPAHEPNCPPGQWKDPEGNCVEHWIATQRWTAVEVREVERPGQVAQTQPTSVTTAIENAEALLQFLRTLEQ
jgi:hypothetical protein